MFIANVHEAHPVTCSTLSTHPDNVKLNLFSCNIVNSSYNKLQIQVVITGVCYITWIFNTKRI